MCCILAQSDGSNLGTGKQVSGLRYCEIFCKNRYIGRTFIKPDDALRKHDIQLKYNPLTHVLKVRVAGCLCSEMISRHLQGKSVVLVDDSLVRGNTLAKLVPLLRKGGAREVHVRISSPPIRHP
jgi:amidophosphoribosyltransferase